MHAAKNYPEMASARNNGSKSSTSDVARNAWLQTSPCNWNVRINTFVGSGVASCRRFFSWFRCSCRRFRTLESTQYGSCCRKSCSNSKYDDSSVATFEGFAEENHVDEEEASAIQKQLLSESLKHKDYENVAELLEERERKRKQLSLLTCRGYYKESTENFGGQNSQAVEAGADLAISLKEAGHGIEAERLASKLLVTSSRVLGLHHECTKFVQNTLLYCKTRIVRYQDQDGISSYEALNYNVVEDTYVIMPLEGPIRVSCSKETKIKVKKSQSMQVK